MICTPLGLPLWDGTIVKREGFFERTEPEDQIYGIKYLYYECVCTESALPERLHYLTVERRQDGTYFLKIPGTNVDMVSPCYWFDSDDRYATHMLPFVSYGARTPLWNAANLRLAINEGKIPKRTDPNVWESI